MSKETMTSRERVAVTLEHKEPDRVPLDLGGSGVTGMQVSTVYKLRQALGLDEPGTPVKVVEPYQMLGEIGLDLIDALGVDVVGLGGTKNLFGFKKEGWKYWTTFDGTPVLVPEGFNTDPEPSGEYFMYPEADKSVSASGRMPVNGWYFDSIIRQPPVDDDNLNFEDNTQEFIPLSDDDVEHYRREAERLYSETDKAILLGMSSLSFGDVAYVPGPQLKNPRGIRDLEEWYISTSTRQDYVSQVFERQCEVGLANLKRLYEAVGDRAIAVFLSGTDFGMQTGPLISPKVFRELFKPFIKEVNAWIHENTPWKVFIHSCGSVRAFYEDFIDAGFDIINPVQTSAAHMAPAELKSNYGDRVTFWGGGVDTQWTLPFGSPGEIREMVRERLKIFGEGGGYVFNTIHNVQARIPVENVLALYETVRDCRAYPLPKG